MLICELMEKLNDIRSGIKGCIDESKHQRIQSIAVIDEIKAWIDKQTDITVNASPTPFVDGYEKGCRETEAGFKKRLENSYGNGCSDGYKRGREEMFERVVARFKSLMED